MGKSLARIMEVIAVLIGTFLYISRPAHAYIDAGTGSYFLQVAIGAIAGVAFSVKLFWQQIYRSLTSLFNGQRSVEKTR